MPPDRQHRLCGRRDPSHACPFAGPGARYHDNPNAGKLRYILLRRSASVFGETLRSSGRRSALRIQGFRTFSERLFGARDVSGPSLALVRQRFWRGTGWIRERHHHPPAAHDQGRPCPQLGGSPRLHAALAFFGAIRLSRNRRIQRSACICPTRINAGGRDLTRPRRGDGPAVSTIGGDIRYTDGMVPAPIVSSIQIGGVAPLGPQSVPSGFVKHGVPQARVTANGLDGDAQADLAVHGGADKAVYGYAQAHYPFWEAQFPRHAGRFTGGAMGENLTIGGLDETALCVGDVHVIGSAVLQVCQPRQPCFKLALFFNDSHMPKAMVRSGRSGWYYRVLAPGTIRAGDILRLENRPHPDFLFRRLVQIVSFGGATQSELLRMAEMDGLAQQWQRRAREVLAGT